MSTSYLHGPRRENNTEVEGVIAISSLSVDWGYEEEGSSKSQTQIGNHHGGLKATTGKFAPQRAEDV